MPRIAKDLHDYLSHSATLLPTPATVEDFAENIQCRHKLGGSTSSLHFGNVAGRNLYAVSIYPDRPALIPGREIFTALVRVFVLANRALLEDARNAVGT